MLTRTALLTALIACVPAFAAEGDAKPEHHHDGPPKELLEKYDTNHDGKLDESERAAMRADRAKAFKEKNPKLFAAIDTDGDGTLSDDELKAAMEAFRSVAPPRRQGPPPDAK